MSSASKYWQLVRLDVTGKRRVEIMSHAKHYFYERFPDIEQADVPDSIIQKELWQRWRSSQSPERDQAEICLRCFISDQVDQACRNLSLKFGSRNGFTYLDVLPFVLDDDGRPQRENAQYRSLWATVLQSFNPAKASLGTWVSLQVKQHSELKRFLLDHGVYLVSDWAILNDTTVKQLQRTLIEIYQFTGGEINYSSALLQSFHAVYREDRLRQKLSGTKQVCQPPTPEQLKRIASELQQRSQKMVSSEAILSQLSSIAQKLRRTRIIARGGAVDAVSLDQPDLKPLLASDQSLPEDNESLAFLKFYQAQFLECFDQAIAQVIPVILSNFQRKKKPVEEAFLTALHLFHCEGRSMSDIAPQVGLKKQYEVTRLLKLSDLRADIRQRSLSDLRDRVVDQAKLYADLDRLQHLEQQVDAILDEQITGVIQEAETEAQSPIRNQPFRSLFARRLCCYLASRKVTHV